MGRGLSKLQKSILAEAKKRDVVLFQEMLDQLCPEFNPVTHAQGKEAGDTIAMFFDIRAKRKSAPWLWASVRDDKEKLPALHRCVIACEEYERKRRSTEAALSRAFTRLESRGLVERVDLTTWHEDHEENRLDQKQRRGIRLTVKPDRPPNDLTDSP